MPCIVTLLQLLRSNASNSTSKPSVCSNGWFGKKNLENNVCTRVTNCFNAHKRVILVFIPELRNNEGNKYQNNTQVSAETFCHESTYIILFLTWHKESINDEKTRSLHMVYVSHSLGFHCPACRTSLIATRFWVVMIVRRAGLLWSQQNFEWLWSVPLSSASLY